ncbi:hypothetical protein ZIOFF_017153 [Zingiber officinale]|uniref:Piwi domain-containing protein n=1 Tax=Zingiber officinale TaxID=94328 RepID=A0A8J5HBD5_ZINOF|nr:hypothetical protein ZIOFF_017153 [Zingiber officinale]
MCKKSIEDPARFWSEIASKFYWKEKWNSEVYTENIDVRKGTVKFEVGGRDIVLVDALSRCIPLVNDRPTIIFGVDVIHSHLGEDSSPYIAVVVVTQDWLEVTKYAGLVCAQAHQELIQDLFKNICHAIYRELLISFKKATGQKSQQIIFYMYESLENLKKILDYLDSYSKLYIQRWSEPVPL